jgi:hypothetical protein
MPKIILLAILAAQTGCTVFIGAPTIEQLNQHGQYRSASTLTGDALLEMSSGGKVDATIPVP